MGREAAAHCQWGGHREPVKALLESTEIRLRGSSIRLRIPLAEVRHIQVLEAGLQFRFGAHLLVLELGAPEAGKWASKMLKPPPTLAARLGVDAVRRAAVLGLAQAADEALTVALQDATTDDAQRAEVLIAVALSQSDLLNATQVHAGMPCRGLWVVHEKGRQAALGADDIRTTLRAMGYLDTKVSGVSERFTATRYVKPV